MKNENVKEVVSDEATGEVLEEIPVFRTQWTKNSKTGLDYSDQFQDTYVEIPPYAKDEKTGKVLNESSKSIYKKGEPFNIFEYTQSFKDDVDLYKILEKFALSGGVIGRDDISIVTGINNNNYADISNIPDNYNEISDYLDSNNEVAGSLGKEIVSDLLDENLSTDLIVEKVTDNLKKSKENKASEKTEPSKGEN